MGPQQPALVLARSPLSVHAAHAAVGLLLAAGVVAVVWLERRAALRSLGVGDRPPAGRRRGRPGVGVLVIAVASVGAALVHADVMPAHWRESAWYGAFFLLAALSQAGYAAVVLIRPTAAVLAVGAAANASVVTLWLLTRLVAVPLGPAAGTREAFAGLDVTASAPPPAGRPAAPSTGTARPESSPVGGSHHRDRR